MARKANPTVVGGFVVGAILLTVAAIFVFGSGRMFTDTTTYVLYFDGSIKGLNVGAPVTFRGVQVGAVTEIKIVADIDDFAIRIPIVVEIDRAVFTRVKGGVEVEGDERISDDAGDLMDILVERGLRAELEMRSVVTGMLAVALDFQPDKPATLIGTDTPYPEIPTVRSGMAELSHTVSNLPIRALTTAVLDAVRAIERLVSSPEIAAGAKAANETLAAVRKLVEDIDKQIMPLGEGLTAAVSDARRLLQNVDKRVEPLATDVEAAVGDARKLITDVDKQVGLLVGGLLKAVEDTRSALAQAKRTLVSVEGVTTEGSAERTELARALREISKSARALRLLADQLERHPESLLHGKRGE
jgi:phospholipid/cholesterol/gamma-HCH transport system substrate-binding protein